MCSSAGPSWYLPDSRSCSTKPTAGASSGSRTRSPSGARARRPVRPRRACASARKGAAKSRRRARWIGCARALCTARYARPARADYDQAGPILAHTLAARVSGLLWAKRRIEHLSVLQSDGLQRPVRHRRHPELGSVASITTRRLRPREKGQLKARRSARACHACRRCAPRSGPRQRRRRRSGRASPADAVLGTRLVIGVHAAAAFLDGNLLVVVPVARSAAVRLPSTPVRAVVHQMSASPSGTGAIGESRRAERRGPARRRRRPPGRSCRLIWPRMGGRDDSRSGSDGSRCGVRAGSR